MQGVWTRRGLSPASCAPDERVVYLPRTPRCIASVSYGTSHLSPLRSQANPLKPFQMSFLSPPSIRKVLAVPTQDKIDFRAACFCHKNIVDIGFVCSVCLSSPCAQLMKHVRDTDISEQSSVNLFLFARRVGKLCWRICS